MRCILERIFEAPFVHVRPGFLRNTATNRCLELDAYNAEFKIGAEFNGVQHAVYPNPFHSTRAQFEKQRQRDALKVQLCMAHGVKLVVVPHHIQRDELEQYLRDQLHDNIAALPRSSQVETEADVFAALAQMSIV